MANPRTQNFQLRVWSELQDCEPNPLPERAPPPFIGVSGLFPQISWREGLPHGDERGGQVHDKGGVHGRGPWQGAVSPKLEKPPSNQDGGLAPLRWDVSHGDVALGA